MSEFQISQRMRQQIDAGRSTQGVSVVSAEQRNQARDLLRRAAVDLVSSRGSVRSGYVVFRTERDGGIGLRTSSRRGGDSAVQFARAFRQLVREGWGDKPGVLDAVDRYLGGARATRGVGTQSLVGLVRALDRLDGTETRPELLQARLSRGRLNADSRSIERAFDLAQTVTHVESLERDAAKWASTDPDRSRQFRELLDAELVKVEGRLSEQPGASERTALLTMSRLLKNAIDTVYRRELDPHGQMDDLRQQGLRAVLGQSAEQLGALGDGLEQLRVKCRAAEDALLAERSQPDVGAVAGPAGGARSSPVEQKLNAVRLMLAESLPMQARLISAEARALRQQLEMPARMDQISPKEMRQLYDRSGTLIDRLQTLAERAALLPAGPEAGQGPSGVVADQLRALRYDREGVDKLLASLPAQTEYRLRNLVDAHPGVAALGPQIDALRQRFEQMDLRIEAQRQATHADPISEDAIRSDRAALLADRESLGPVIDEAHDDQRAEVERWSAEAGAALIDPAGRASVDRHRDAQLARIEASRTKARDALAAIRSGLTMEVPADQLVLARAGRWPELAAALRPDGMRSLDAGAIAAAVRGLGLAASTDALKGLFGVWFAPVGKDDKPSSRRRDADEAARLMRAIVLPPGREFGVGEAQRLREVWASLATQRPLMAGELAGALAGQCLPPVGVTDSQWTTGSAAAHHYSQSISSSQGDPLLAPGALVRFSSIKNLSMGGADLRNALVVLDVRPGEASQLGVSKKLSLAGASLDGTRVILDARNLKGSDFLALFSFKDAGDHRAMAQEARGAEDDSGPVQALSVRELGILPATGLVGLLASIDGERYPELKRDVTLQVLQIAIDAHSGSYDGLLRYSPLLQTVQADSMLLSDSEIRKQVELASELAEMEPE